MRITNLKPLISEEAIQTRVKEMAGEISTLYKDEPLVVVCVLKGAFMFFSDLVRHLTCKPELDFVRLASYGSAAQRSKTITFTKDVEIPLEGKHVLIVEDIVDSGNTLCALKELFQKRGAKSVRCCCLLDKKERREAPIEADYVGFDVPDKFLVGYGLDYAGKYRNLKFVGTLKPEIYRV